MLSKDLLFKNRFVNRQLILIGTGRKCIVEEIIKR